MILVDIFVAASYELRGEQGIPERQLLVLGPGTLRTHHLNLVTTNGPFWREHLVFRERLRAEPDLSVAYAALKRELAAQHGADRRGYKLARSPSSLPYCTTRNQRPASDALRPPLADLERLRPARADRRAAWAPRTARPVGSAGPPPAAQRRGRTTPRRARRQRWR
jgi:hypothetical protein